MFDIVGMGNAIVDLTTLAAENQAFANINIYSTPLRTIILFF